VSGVLLEKSIDKSKELISFVVGNGESRGGFDLHRLDQHETWACNLSALDFDAEHAVAADRYIVNALIKQQCSATIWTREDNRSLYEKHEHVKYFPPLPYKGDHKYDQQIHWGSGLNAAMMACAKDKQMICFLGFDLYGTVEDPTKINNIYKNQDGYSDANSRAVDPRHWIYQFERLFKLYPQTSFVFIKRLDYPRANWDEFPNVYFDTYENLHYYLNEIRDPVVGTIA